ncbi:MAG: hypothetical protein AVDCRST_MAG17-1791 [uncultured Solirubrobacterales bacterium]|uniref:Uncharacterized protein n=1 Tax=uncultured Solirubrobacterales bacterium TaxID=768556 RepID=A0A6J4SZ24_9ACTN|nr:MAG: hypothetical protein AVDCRST_MAG17-1791 [uncultured Solirubrobacterales bacterium]
MMEIARRRLDRSVGLARSRSQSIDIVGLDPHADDSGQQLRRRP